MNENPPHFSRRALGGIGAIGGEGGEEKIRGYRTEGHSEVIEEQKHQLTFRPNRIGMLSV